MFAYLTNLCEITWGKYYVQYQTKHKQIRSLWVVMAPIKCISLATSLELCSRKAARLSITINNSQLHTSY